jgi:hypothetical protein
MRFKSSLFLATWLSCLSPVIPLAKPAATAFSLGGMSAHVAWIVLGMVIN